MLSKLGREHNTLSHRRMRFGAVMDLSLPCPAPDLKLKFHRSTKRLHCPTQPIAQIRPGSSSGSSDRTSVQGRHYPAARNERGRQLRRPNCPRRPTARATIFRIQRCTDRRYCTLCIRIYADRSQACLARCEQAPFSRRTSCMVPPSGDHEIRSGFGEKRA